ncbi:hypothetical protein SAMN05192585_1059 [Acetanaerobacterium elongatum]|uniref:Uncharacterized protein n=1 Tax=Acetanaerobacterium elongatum TaxID=258515 RepID=A0A1G9W1G6_9FIRM|nr:hypothetical protein SAMN05192585_1059 [Acetanaerobacterium elongatum]
MWSKAGYNEYDFMRMKQDAINQAKEMQRRAAPSTANVSPSTDGWQNVQQAQPPASPPPNTPAQEPQRCPNCGSPIIDGKHVSSPNNQPKAGRGRGRPAATPRQNPNRMQNKPQNVGNTTPQRPPSGRRNTNTRQANPAAQARQGPLNEAANAETIGASSTHEEYTEASQSEQKPAAPSFGKINIPILGDIDIDRDVLLIGGLLLVLITDDGDRMLMLALVYIMMG